MKHVYAAGVVVWCNTPFGIEYLLIRHAKGGHWDFPKGRLEENETDRQAALRELQEETGIASVRIMDDFFATVSYNPVYDGKQVQKTVNYCMGWVKNQFVQLSDEHDEYAWLPYEQAHERLTHDRSKDLLDKVSIYIKN